MDQEGTMLCEINQRKNEYWMILFIWKLKKIQQISERNKKLTHTYREQNSRYQCEQREAGGAIQK